MQYYISVYDAVGTLNQRGAETTTDQLKITCRRTGGEGEVELVWRWTGEVTDLGFEEADGDAVVLQTVDSQFAAAGRRKRLPGDELQQANQSDSGLQLRVDVGQLHLLLQDEMTAKDSQMIFNCTFHPKPAGELQAYS